MHPSLKRNLYLVRERLGILQAASNYDIVDPESFETVLECREERLGPFAKFLRFTDYKRMTPFEIEVRTPSGERVIQVGRGVSVFLAKVDVHDETGRRIGGFRQELSSIGGRFEVLDENDEPICRLVGKWTTWEFRFVDDGAVEYARASRQCGGMGSDLLSTADNYRLEIHENVSPEHPMRPLILAAVLCIDMVMKE